LKTSRSSRYLLFQFPGWAVAMLAAVGLWSWITIDPWVAGGLCALWVLKDFVFYCLCGELRRAEAAAGRLGGRETFLIYGACGLTMQADKTEIA